MSRRNGLGVLVAAALLLASSSSNQAKAPAYSAAVMSDGTSYGLGFYDGSSLIAGLSCEMPSASRHPVSVSLVISTRTSGPPAAESSFTVNGRGVVASIELRADAASFAAENVRVQSLDATHFTLLGDFARQAREVVDAVSQAYRVEIVGDGRVIGADLSEAALEMDAFAESCREFLAATPSKLEQMAAPPGGAAPDDDIFAGIEFPEEPAPPAPGGPVDVKAIVAQADSLSNGDEATNDDPAAFKLYMTAAELGDAYAMNAVGLMYDEGRGVALDGNAAVAWYRKSADAGYRSGVFNVGTAYDRGVGVDEDAAEALTWYRKAAQLGSPQAMRAIAEAFRLGRGVDADMEEAATWYQKAADAGDVASHWALGALYLNGDGGLSKDSSKAAELAYFALRHQEQTAHDGLTELRRSNTSRNFMRRLQELLKDDGFYDGDVDGTPGPATRVAIELAFRSPAPAN